MRNDDAKKTMTEKDVKRESARRTRRSFLVGAAGAAAGAGLYRYLDRAPGDQLLSRPLRKALNFNEAVARGVFDERALAPTYPLSRATDLRINGNFGLKQPLKMDSWRLQLVGVDQPKRFPQYVDDVTTWDYVYTAGKTGDGGPSPKERPKAGPVSAARAGGEPKDAMSPEFQKAFDKARKANEANETRPERGREEAGESDNTLDPGTPGLLLTMADLDKLPRHDLVTQFKCIEGWSQIVQWRGVRLSDLLDAYPPAKNDKGELPKFVYMETPDGDYYTGYQWNECRHPQSLLVTEMMGKPLTQEHGAPLRLHMPIKYGYKQIKRIGLIAYTDDRPDDYWTKLGYDWYAGL